MTHSTLNPFADQANFMAASGQQILGQSQDQFALYHNLVFEEGAELSQALHDLLRHTRVEVAEPDQQYVTDLIHRTAAVADGIVDSIVVLIGLGYSMGLDMEAAWQEVHRSNMAKIDPETGQVLKREDGKVQKPLGWTPPDMVKIVMQSWERLNAAA